MRVLYLTEESISFSDAMVRGGAIHVRNVVEGLRERGHDVFLLDWNSAPERPYQVSVAPRTRFVDGAVKTYRQAVLIGRRHGVDAVVSKTRKTYVAGLAASRRLGIPHVVHVGSSLNPPTSGLVDRVDLASFRARLQLPHDAYFTVCRYLVNQLVNRGIDPGDVYDVRNAVDTERFHPSRIDTSLSPTYRGQLPDDAFLLGFIGGLHEYKGVYDLADAIERCRDTVTVAFAGDGPERKPLEARLGDHGRFLGSVPYEQIPALYHEFDVLVLPSHTEGLPRVVLEAQATGTPVVATRVGGIPEVVSDGETGLLCDPHSPESLATAIDRLAGDPAECEHLARMGRDRVAAEYSWNALLDRYERFLMAVSEEASAATTARRTDESGA